MWFSLLKNHAPESLYLSSVTVGELYLGAFKSQKIESNLSKIEVMVQAFQIFNFDLEVAKVFAQIRSDLKKKELFADRTICKSQRLQNGIIVRW